MDTEAGNALREFEEASARPCLTRNQKIARHHKKTQEAMHRHFYLDTITENDVPVKRFKSGYARGVALPGSSYRSMVLSML